MPCQGAATMHYPNLFAMLGDLLARYSEQTFGDRWDFYDYGNMVGAIGEQCNRLPGTRANLGWAIRIEFGEVDDYATLKRHDDSRTVTCGLRDFGFVTICPKH